MMPDVHMCRWISMMADWASRYKADVDKTGGQSAKKGMRCTPQDCYAGPECQADGSGAGAAAAGGGENVPERVRPIHSHSSGHASPD